MTEHRLMVLDTTSRDGKQAPGNQHSPEQTVLLARQLVRLGVDVMEAGFPFSGNDDFESVRRVATEVAEIRPCALASAHFVDGTFPKINAAVRALENSIEPPRIHVFIATSDIHIDSKFKMNRDQVIELAARAVEYARKYVDDVEFTPEDTSRTGFEITKKVTHEVVLAGARTINYADTVGYALPRHITSSVRKMQNEIPIISEKEVVISVHCHNDLGLAVANTLAGIDGGARQIETTMAGIGERAGNTQLEAVIMALRLHDEYQNLNVSIDTEEFGPTTRLLSQIIGKALPDNIPIVGENVFAHGAGIHQDGVAKNKKTYEIMTPESVGWKGKMFPLSSQSGRRGLLERLEDIGYVVEKDVVDIVYDRFMEVAGTRSLVHNDDLHLIMQEIMSAEHVENKDWIKFVSLEHCNLSNSRLASIKLLCGDRVIEANGRDGKGPVDTTWRAIKNALSRQDLWLEGVELDDFVCEGIGSTDALGLSRVTLCHENDIAYGRGADDDIVRASARAIIDALNHLRFTPINGKEV